MLRKEFVRCVSRRSSWLSPALLACVLTVCARAVALPPGPQSAERKFDPVKHFPTECFFYLGGDAGKLLRGLGETPVGSILTHPRVVQALGQLPAELKKSLLSEINPRRFEERFGMPVEEFLESFLGRIAITSPTMTARNGPSLLMSFEMIKNRKRLEGVFKTMATLEGGGTPPTARKYKGVEIHQWAVRWGEAQAHAFLGNTAVFGLNGASIEPVIDIYKGGSREASLAGNKRFRLARERAKVGSREALVVAYFDVRLFREKLYEFFTNPDFPGGSEQGVIKTVFQALGFDRVETAIAQIGMRDGDLEGRLVVESPKGNGGAVKVFGDLFRGPSDYAGLSKIPASATYVKAGSLRLGATVRESIRLFREAAAVTGPRDLAEVNDVIGYLESNSGLSAKGDLYPLGRLDLFSFLVTPPAGGWIPDALVLCKTEELKPYLSVARKLALKFRGSQRPIESMGVEMTYLRLAGILESFGLPAPESLQADGGVDFQRALSRAFRNPALGVYWRSLDSEWTVLGFTPQAVARYVKFYGAAPKVSEDPELMEIVQGRIVRGSSFAIARGGRSVVSAYNSMTSLLGRLRKAFSREFQAVGFDPALFPAGEIFVDRFEDGFLAVRGTKTTVHFHGHRFVSNLASGFVLPAMMLVSNFRSSNIARAESIQAREARVARVATDEHGHRHNHEEVALPPEATRLVEIGALFEKYRKKTGSRAYPFDPRGGVHPFQKLADAGVLDDPSKLVHPLSADRPAGKTAAGKITIEERNVSYRIVPWKQGPRDLKSRILCYEKQAFKGGGRYVLFVDRRVEFVREAKFRALLREQTTRYGKKKGE